MSRFVVGFAQGALTGWAGDAVGAPGWLIVIQIVVTGLAIHMGATP